MKSGKSELPALLAGFRSGSTTILINVGGRDSTPVYG